MITRLTRAFVRALGTVRTISAAQWRLRLAAAASVAAALWLVTDATTDASSSLGMGMILAALVIGILTALQCLRPNSDVGLLVFLAFAAALWLSAPLSLPRACAVAFLLGAAHASWAVAAHARRHGVMSARARRAILSALGSAGLLSVALAVLCVLPFAWVSAGSLPSLVLAGAAVAITAAAVALLPVTPENAPAARDS